MTFFLVPKCHFDKWYKNDTFDEKIQERKEPFPLTFYQASHVTLLLGIAQPFYYLFLLKGKF